MVADSPEMPADTAAAARASTSRTADQQVQQAAPLISPPGRHCGQEEEETHQSRARGLHQNTQAGEPLQETAQLI